MIKQDKFEELFNQLSFNIFNYQPDSTIYWFIKKYYPYLTAPHQNTGWTAYPPGPVPDFKETVHSVKFKRHPYFDADYKIGRLDIETQEEKEGICSLSGISLSFLFDAKSKADTAFRKLCNMFGKVGSEKKVYTVKGRPIAECSATKMGFQRNVYFVLMPDEVYPNRFEIKLKFIGYKYDIELNKY